MIIRLSLWFFNPSTHSHNSESRNRKAINTLDGLPRQLGNENATITGASVRPYMKSWLGNLFCIADPLWGDPPMASSFPSHDAMTWKPFPHCWPLWGDPPVTSSFPSRKASDTELSFYHFLSGWTKCWPNNWVAGGLRHQDAPLAPPWCQW